MWQLVSFVFVLMFILFDRTGWASADSADSAKLKNPVKATAESIASGQAVFQKYCRFCHGADATGDGPLAPKGSHPPNLVDDTWDHGSSDGEIFTNIRDGIAPTFDMKPNKDKLSEQEIWNVVNYLRSIGTKKK